MAYKYIYNVLQLSNVIYPKFNLRSSNESESKQNCITKTPASNIYIQNLKQYTLASTYKYSSTCKEAKAGGGGAIESEQMSISIENEL